MKKGALGLSAVEYAKNKISIEMSKIKQSIKSNTSPSEIGHLPFDRCKFDLKLDKEIKIIYGESVQLLRCWNEFFEKSNLYFQLDCLGNAYGYTFEKFGTYRDYGMIIFYANSVKNYDEAVKKLVEKWFDTVVYPSYISDKAKYDKKKRFTKELFEFCQVWEPICHAACHFNEKLTVKDIKQYIAELAEKYDMGIKSIGYSAIVFY